MVKLHGNTFHLIQNDHFFLLDHLSGSSPFIFLSQTNHKDTNRLYFFLKLLSKNS